MTSVEGLDSTAVAAVMQGAYDGLLCAGSVPPMHERGALNSPRGWFAANLARIASFMDFDESTPSF